ncbi:MAG: hypothetical protein ABIH38_01220 [Patescibacteria group bacterium]
MNGRISKTGDAGYFFIAGDDGGNYYSRDEWVYSSFRGRIELNARVEFQTRVWQGKPQAFAVRAEALAASQAKSVRTVKFDEHHDGRLQLLHSILEEGRKPSDDEQKTLFAVWLTDAQGHLLTDQYDCGNCARHPRFYRQRFDGLYVVTFGQDYPAVILCEKCRRRFSQLYPSCQTNISPLYDTLERLGIRPNGRGWTLGQAANSHRREKNRRIIKPIFQASEKARQSNEELVEKFSKRWREQKTA